MEKTFGMSPATYGFAAGIFYIGYVLAEVPSNILMLKVGARIWLSRRLNGRSIWIIVIQR